MNTAVVTYGEMERMAATLAKSGLFGVKDPTQAMALMSIAAAEGVHPAKAMQLYHIIEGKPALRADALLARYQAAGGRVDWTSYTDAKVAAKFTHPQAGSIEIDWTIERAKQAGLADRPQWKKYPRQMLRSRVISEGVRTSYPGLNVGIYTSEEVQDMVIDERGIKDVTPEPEPPRTNLDEGEVADHLAAIEAAADLTALRRAYQTAYGAAKQAADVSALEQFDKAKERRKLALTAEDAPT